MASEGLNKCMLIGNLGMDPELKFTPGGQAVLRMRLATTERYANKAGERQEKTEWHTVILWGKRAEALGKILHKGKTLYIEGRIETRQWEDKDGGKRSTTEINASQVLLLGGRDDRQESAGGGSGYSAQPSKGGGYGGKPSGGAPPADDFPPDDFGDDQIPFDATPSVSGLPEGVIKRFWSHVEKTDGCWNWTASVGSHGYGNAYDGVACTVAHRLSYRINVGPVAGRSEFVLHSCDNRRCVNPAHLRLGTHKENMEDTVRRRRHEGRWKLSPEIAREIRASNESQKVMARKYGVSQRSIQAVLRGLAHRETEAA